MSNRSRNTVNKLLLLLSAIPAAASALNTTVTLTADGTITPTASEIVTFGLPLAEGDVYNLNDIRVLIDGVEQMISIEAGLTWHWSDSSLRSVTIQLRNADMTDGDVKVSITDAGNAAPTRSFLPHHDGWATGPADKANMPFPRVFAVHDLDYLASTGIIPPYTPGTSGEGVGQLQSEQFDNGFGDLDFSVNGAGSQASYLFDRATAMMKAYMATGEIKFLKEGFMTKQLYFSHIRDDGASPARTGGEGCFTFGSVNCRDGKYIYTEPAKLAWALLGDNSQWDNSLIDNMAFQADLGDYQASTRDLYDSESELFTERAAGLVGLAELAAYEITGNPRVLAHLNERIDSLKDMQQVEKSWEKENGWIPKSGAFTHSWCRHEGCASGYPGDGTTDDRRFSPWMSENIADFLWQAYNITGRSDIPEMLRLLGNAIDLYGFTSSYLSGVGLSSTYQNKNGLNTITLSCSAADPAPTSMLYSGSAFASAEALSETALAYTDQHNVEVILPLALAFYFETNSDSRTRLYSRIKHLERQWLSNTPEDCSRLTRPPRVFNWQHRSNSVRTWNWVLTEFSGDY